MRNIQKGKQVIIVKISSNSVEVGGSDEDNLNIALAYLETVKAAAIKIGVNVAKNDKVISDDQNDVEIAGEKGPLELQYLAQSGKQKMRTTREEKNSGMSREEIAEARIRSMNGVEVSGESDDGTNQY